MYVEGTVSCICRTPGGETIPLLCYISFLHGASQLLRPIPKLELCRNTTVHATRLEALKPYGLTGNIATHLQLMFELLQLHLQLGVARRHAETAGKEDQA